VSKIGSFLDSHRVTQTDVAEALGLDPSTINRKVSGERPWKLDEFQALIAFLSKRLDRVVTYDDLMEPALVAPVQASEEQGG